MVDAMASANALTIEQLAAESGMTVRNIRAHRARGLLPAPEVRDRIGYYGPEHLARLRLIARMQGDGFNLRAIERLLESGNVGPEQLMSLTDAINTPYESEEPAVFTAISQRPSCASKSPYPWPRSRRRACSRRKWRASSTATEIQSR